MNVYMIVELSLKEKHVHHLVQFFSVSYILMGGAFV